MRDLSQRFSPVLGTILLSGVLTCSLALNVVLVWRLRAVEVPDGISSGGLRVGQRLIGLSVSDSPRGKPLPLFAGHDAKPTVLFVFSPQCTWSSKDHPNILSLSKQLGQTFRFVALSTMTNGLDAYLEKYPFPFPVVRLSLSPTALDGFEVTPQTVVVGTGGEVTRAWTGALAARRQTQAEVEEHFGVTLPGVESEKKESAQP